MNAVCRVVRPSGERESIRLAMQRLWLTGRVYPVGAHLVVKHEFVSSEEQPLEVVYSFMLPRDTAMRRFRVEALSEEKRKNAGAQTEFRSIPVLTAPAGGGRGDIARGGGSFHRCHATGGHPFRSQ